MTRGPLAQKFWESIPPERQKEIEKKAARHIAEYQNLQALRQSAGLTQRNLSRLERNSDMLLSTLQKYVAAIGGKLHLTVELPDKAPISLTGLGDLIEPTSSLPE